MLCMNNNNTQYYQEFNEHRIEGSERLKAACRIGNLNEVRYLLTSPEWIGYIDIHHDDDIALCLACQGGHLDIVQYLLTSPELTEHADIRAYEHFLIKIVCSLGNLSILQLLMKVDDSYVKDYCKTAITLAARHGQLSIIRYLNDIYLHNENYGGMMCCALFNACGCGNIPIVRYLLCSSHVGYHWAQEDLNKAAYYSAHHGCVDLYRFLTTSKEIDSHAILHVDENLLNNIAKNNYVAMLRVLLSDATLKKQIEQLPINPSLSLSVKNGFPLIFNELSGICSPDEMGRFLYDVYYDNAAWLPVLLGYISPLDKQEIYTTAMQIAFSNGDIAGVDYFSCAGAEMQNLFDKIYMCTNSYAKDVLMAQYLAKRTDIQFNHTGCYIANLIKYGNLDALKIIKQSSVVDDSIFVAWFHTWICLILKNGKPIHSAYTMLEVLFHWHNEFYHKLDVNVFNFFRIGTLFEKVEPSDVFALLSILSPCVLQGVIVNNADIIMTTCLEQAITIPHEIQKYIGVKDNFEETDLHL